MVLDTIKGGSSLIVRADPKGSQTFHVSSNKRAVLYQPNSTSINLTELICKLKLTLNWKGFLLEDLNKVSENGH